MGFQRIVEFDAADSFCLHLTTMKAMNFQDDISSFPIDFFNNHYLLVFALISMEDATENCHNPHLGENPQRLERTFTSPLEHVTELIVLEELMSSVAVDKFRVVRKTI